MKTFNPQKFGVVLFLILWAASAGCSRNTVREEKVVTPAGTATVSTTTAPSTSTTTVIEKETVVEDNPSVLGTVFNVVGEVIALPFRLVAGIFRFIF